MDVQKKALSRASAIYTVAAFILHFVTKDNIFGYKLLSMHFCKKGNAYQQSVAIDFANL